jgi:hypothetical protein
MKKLNKVLFAAVLATTFGLAYDASAQYKPSGDNGITASPRLRQMFNEGAVAPRVAPVSPSVTVTYRNPADGVTASPRLRQMLAERKVIISGAPSADVASAGYRPTGADGVTASPKMRQELGEHGPTFMIAPVK